MASKISLKFLALLVVTVMITTCGGPGLPVDNEGPVEVEVEKEVIKEVEVEVRLLGWPTSPVEEENFGRCGVTYEPIETDYWERLQDMFFAGEEFDIFTIDPTHVPSFAEQGFLAPLDDLAGIQRDEFIDRLIEAFTFRGTTYGIPRDFTTLALFYNRDLFNEAGLLEPTDDWNWGDLRDVGRAITEITGVPGFFARTRYFPIFVLQNGDQIMTEDFSDTHIDSPQAIEAGYFYADARWNGWTITQHELEVWEGEAFGRGDVAMVLGRGEMIGYLSNQFPDLTYGAVHPPAGPAGEGNLFFPTAYAVSANSTAPQAALDAITCLTSEESQIRMMESGMALPTRWSLAGHPYLQDNPIANTIFTGAEFATPFNWGPRHEEVDFIIGQALERAYQGEMSVEESFSQAAEEIREIIGR